MKNNTIHLRGVRCQRLVSQLFEVYWVAMGGVVKANVTL